MIGLATPGRPIASGPHTSPGLQQHRITSRTGEQAPLASDIDDDPGGVDDDPTHPPPPQGTEHLGRGEQGAVSRSRWPVAAAAALDVTGLVAQERFEGVEVDDDVDQRLR